MAVREAETTRQAYYEAKAAFRKAETEFRKVFTVYRRLWRENHARDRDTEPSEEFQRTRQAYEVASAALSEARERFQSLRSTLPIRGNKPFKYGVPSDEGDEEDPDGA